MVKWLVCAGLVVVPTFGTAQSVVCAGKIIDEGISQMEVTAKCGTPAQVDHRTKTLVAAIGTGTQLTYIAGSSDDVQVDVWTYNFGPSRLMQRIWFENGVVTRVESLGYGF
ncbi:MAG: DUF2845 domain-containing protein [Terriglobales bacterium]